MSSKNLVLLLVMVSRGFWRLEDVSDTRLRSGLAELLTAGYRTEARIIAHLAEVEQRKLHLKDGSASLYDYCTRVLRLSNSEAFHRITAARVARKFPIVFSLIEQRKLHLTAVCLLRDYLTLENHRELLGEAAHKTKWQIQELVARRFPRPDVESRVRKLPTPRTAAPAVATQQVTPSPDVPHLPIPNSPLSPVPSPLLCAAEPPFNGPSPPSPSPPSPSPPSPSPPSPSPPSPSPSPHAASLPQVSCGPPRAAAVPIPVQPLSEARYRIQLNASAALKEKLDRLRALTSHSNPSGDIAVVIERALDLALEKVEKQRFAKTDRPRSAVQSSQPLRCPQEREVTEGSVQAKLNGPKSERFVSAATANAAPRERKHIPNAVRREIAERDGAQCSYRGPNGCRCTARAFLQIHHERPWARGGGETAGNLRLLCAAHNQWLAKRDFGARHVQWRQSEHRRRSERARGTDP